MPQTQYTMSVNDAGSREAVTATTVCRTITVCEDPSVANWPTTDYKVASVSSGGTPVQRPGGTAWTFSKPGGYNAFFKVGDVAGYLEAVSGSTTFQVIEEY